MVRNVFAVSIAALATCCWVRAAQTEKAAMPNVAGNYRCTPNPTPCPQEATTFSVSQSDNRVLFKGDKGMPGSGTMTSPTTITIGAPWNMMGVVQSDGQIHWSNGTIWRKQ